MKFIYVVRTNLHIYPPCLNQILMLRELGKKVLVICNDCDNSTITILNQAGVKTVCLNIKRSNIASIGKIQSYVEYSIKTKAMLNKFYNKDDLIWYGTADSCFAMGNYYSKFPFILNVLELYDDNKRYRNGVARVINSAKAVIVCEKTRADIMKMWWNLNNNIFVMPNKPYSLPKIKTAGTIQEAQNAIELISNKKVFLYQGIIAADRNLNLLAKALKQVNNCDLYLALMGNDSSNSVKMLKKIYENTIYLGFVPAPYHLEVTSNAYAGIAYYQATNLNNLFCAPNKIYEYSGLGLPILCNDIPGLRNTVKTFGAGECVDFENIDDLSNAIREIDLNHNSYSSNSENLYKSVDNMNTMKQILDLVKA